MTIMLNAAQNVVIALSILLHTMMPILSKQGLVCLYCYRKHKSMNKPLLQLSDPVMRYMCIPSQPIIHMYETKTLHPQHHFLQNLHHNYYFIRCNKMNISSSTLLHVDMLGTCGTFKKVDEQVRKKTSHVKPLLTTIQSPH